MSITLPTISGSSRIRLIDARDRDEAAWAELHAEGGAHDVLEPVRLVEHDDVVLGEERAACTDVQSVEVRVDDDHVGDCGTAAGQLGEARLAHRAAVGAGALVAADGDRSHHRVAGSEVQLGDVAGRCRRHPLGDALQIGDRLRRQLAQLEPSLGILAGGGGELAQALQAHVVAAPLEHGPVEVDGQGLGEEREVLAGELVLQRLGGGGDDDAPAGCDRRNEVGERLARAGAGLHDEVAPALEGGGDEVGHALLARPLLGVRERGGDGTQRRGGRRLRQLTSAIAGSSSSPSNSGQVFSVKYTGAPAACQSRKLDTRPSPLVRTSTSTGGSSGR